ncbi:hypothetical protein GF354_04005 [Candidatus Peregrinibacteria bacterium]|nr:hypothetical protein [Candidatus Peregrinibacteria bacterium]
MTKTNFLTKLSFILFGIFATSLILAFSINLFGETGIWISVIICAILLILSFVLTQKGSIFRWMAIGIAGTLILATVVYLSTIAFLTETLEGY